MPTWVDNRGHSWEIRLTIPKMRMIKALTGWVMTVETNDLTDVAGALFVICRTQDPRLTEDDFEELLEQRFEEGMDALNERFSELNPISATIKAAMVEVIPALPNRINVRIIFLLTG